MAWATLGAKPVNIIGPLSKAHPVGGSPSAVASEFQSKNNWHVYFLEYTKADIQYNWKLVI